MGRRDSTSGSGFTLAVRGLVLLLLTQLASASLLAADSNVAEQLLARAVFTLVLGMALLPQPVPGQPPRLGLLLCWSLLSGASIAPGALWLQPDFHVANRVAVLAGGTALLVFLFGSLCWCLAGRLGDRRLAAQATLTTLLLGLTLPLWLSPLAVLHGGDKWFVDSIVALCPASYLATIIDIDFLRGDWMYRHTPYGSLRFDYPDALRASVTMLAAAAVFIGAGRFRLSSRRTDRFPVIAPQLPEPKP